MSQKPFHPELLKSIAEEYGTPTYVYSESIIQRQLRNFRNAFAAQSTRVLYAMKANSNPWVLQTILADGIGIDAVSPGEALLALRLGVDSSQIFYSANNCSNDELDWASDQGFVINIGEFSRFEDYVVRHPGTDVCIRLNLNIGAGHHDHVVTGGDKSKFGIRADDFQQTQDLAARHNVTIAGIHQHIGSGSTDPEPLIRGIEALASMAVHVPGLRFVNMGGGFGVSYEPGQQSLDVCAVADAVNPALDSLSKNGIESWFEPGRYFVAEAGVLLTKVNALKTTATRCFAGTDSGMNHLIRPSLYGSYHHVHNLSNPDGAPITYDIVGNICETGDFFARDRTVQDIREGDLLTILDTGAYSISMASLYNLRPLPAEVAILNSGETVLLSSRVTPEDVVDEIVKKSNLVLPNRHR